MTKEVSEAAERLRNPPPHSGSLKEVFASNRQFCEDVKAVTDAYIALIHADDGEAIDDELCVSLGGEFCDDGIYRFASPGGIELFAWTDNSTVNFSDPDHVEQITKGGLRGLLAVLHIHLKEQP